MKELKSLKKIFEDKIFRIPDYQRGYAWSKSQLSEFWEDLINLEDDRYHYTGVITLKAVEPETWDKWNDEKWLKDERDYEAYYVVDGQQRLTTFVIFLQSLIEVVKELPEHKDKTDDEVYLGSFKLKDIKENFIVISRPPDDVIRTYKFGYETDNPSFKFLRYKIFNEQDAGTVDETFYTLNLENAKKFFLENLKAVTNNHGSSGLELLYKKLTIKLMFNVFEIGTDFDVYVAFETMNNRGKRLSDLELLKNRLIYLTTLYRKDEVKEDVRRKLRDNINDAWKEVYRQLGRNKHHPLNDDDFLRAHWIMYFKYSRKKGNDYIRYLLDEQFAAKNILEKIEVQNSSIEEIEEFRDDENGDEDISDTVESKPHQRAKLSVKEIDDYVKSLQSTAVHWFNSWNPINNKDLTASERLWLDRLNRIGIAYFRPLVVSSFLAKNVNSIQRVELFQAIERFIFVVFRMTRYLANYRSSEFYIAARELYKGNSTVQSIIKLLNDHVNSIVKKDGSFDYDHFYKYIGKKYQSGGGFYLWPDINYFLFEYEQHLVDQRGNKKIEWQPFIKNDKDKVSIEHIYPQTPIKDCWQKAFEKFNEEQKTRLQGSLGNLVPLSQSINSSLQNDCFDEKRKTKLENGKKVRLGYHDGSHSEIEVALYNKWTANEIMERGLRLLDFLEERWNLKFASKADKLKLLHLDFMEPDISNNIKITPISNAATIEAVE